MGFLPVTFYTLKKMVFKSIFFFLAAFNIIASVLFLELLVEKNSLRLNTVFVQQNLQQNETWGLG